MQGFANFQYEQLARRLVRVGLAKEGMHEGLAEKVLLKFAQSVFEFGLDKEEALIFAYEHDIRGIIVDELASPPSMHFKEVGHLLEKHGYRLCYHGEDAEGRALIYALVRYSLDTLRKRMLELESQGQSPRDAFHNAQWEGALKIGRRARVYENVEGVGSEADILALLPNSAKEV